MSTDTETTPCAVCDAPVTRVDGTDHTEADATYSHPIAPGHAYEFLDDPAAVGRLCLSCHDTFGAGTIAYVQRNGNAVASAVIDDTIVWWGDERAINTAGDAIRAVARDADWTATTPNRGHDDLPRRFQVGPTVTWTKALAGDHLALADSQQATIVREILEGDRELERDVVIAQTLTGAITSVAIYTPRDAANVVASHFADTVAEPAHAGIR